MPNAPTLASLADDLESGRTTARKLVEECLVRIADPDRRGPADLHPCRQGSRACGGGSDGRLRKANAAPSRFAGIPVSIKDLFDIKGQVTRAGSRALEDSAPARRGRAGGGAAAARRLHRDRPHQHDRVRLFRHRHQSALRHAEGAWHRSEGHVPGGSSSGAAVSVVDRMAYGALGTDTGGSCRIPAAYNGIVGYKPTQRRMPLDGGVPLSFTLDSFGPLARSVACCAMLDAVLAGEPIAPLSRA